MFPRSASMNGAPRKIQRKQGAKVTQVASRPPSVAGQERGQPRRSRKAPRKPTNCSDHDQRPGRRLGHAEAVEHLARLEPAIGADRLLCDIGEHRIGAAEGHHRHLARRRWRCRRRRCPVQQRARAPRPARARAPTQHRRPRSAPSRVAARHRRPCSSPSSVAASATCGAADRPVAAADPKAGEPGARADEADQRRRRGRSAGTGTPKAKIATKASAAMARIAPFLSAACRCGRPPAARSRAPPPSARRRAPRRADIAEDRRRPSSGP